MRPPFEISSAGEWNRPNPDWIARSDRCFCFFLWEERSELVRSLSEETGARP